MVKSYCYQDLHQKSSEVLLYARVEEGGLGLLYVQSKALVHFLAASSKYRKSLFHSWLFRYHVSEEVDLPNPGYTPYYDQTFFEVIQYMKDRAPLNPVYIALST